MDFIDESTTGSVKPPHRGAAVAKQRRQLRGKLLTSRVRRRRLKSVSSESEPASESSYSVLAAFTNNSKYQRDHLDL